MGRRRYSFVDVLERVVDGVQVQIVRPVPHRQERGSEAADHPRKPRSRSKRHPRTSDR